MAKAKVGEKVSYAKGWAQVCTFCMTVVIRTDGINRTALLLVGRVPVKVGCDWSSGYPLRKSFQCCCVLIVFVLFFWRRRGRRGRKNAKISRGRGRDGRHAQALVLGK
jgi:hypothetical protein